MDVSIWCIGKVQEKLAKLYTVSPMHIGYVHSLLILSLVNGFISEVTFLLDRITKLLSSRLK